MLAASNHLLRRTESHLTPADFMLESACCLAFHTSFYIFITLFVLITNTKKLTGALNRWRRCDTILFLHVKKSFLSATPTVYIWDFNKIRTYIRTVPSDWAQISLRVMFRVNTSMDEWLSRTGWSNTHSRVLVCYGSQSGPALVIYWTLRTVRCCCREAQREG